MSSSQQYNAALTGRIPDTEINEELAAVPAIPPGTYLVSADQRTRYSVHEKLNVRSAEADHYQCVSNGTIYVAKIYRGEHGLTEAQLESLRQVDSPNVARLQDTGQYQGHHFEIWPYFAKGSLEAGHIYTYTELRSRIIPQLNEGLHALHARERRILHMDLKPSNIMITDTDGLAISDFGSSLELEAGLNEMRVTKVESTPGFVAPELRGDRIAWQGSDYYALGITIFYLATGELPYERRTSDLSQREALVTRLGLDYPRGMHPDLHDLIKALTYPDITNMGVLGNRNKRWTYEEVRAWSLWRPNEPALPWPDPIWAERRGVVARIRLMLGHTRERFSGAGARSSGMAQGLRSGWRRLWDYQRRSKLGRFFIAGAVAIALGTALLGLYLNKDNFDPRAATYISVPTRDGVTPWRDLEGQQPITVVFDSQAAIFHGGKQQISYLLGRNEDGELGHIEQRGSIEVYFNDFQRNQEIVLLSFDFTPLEDYLLSIRINGVEVRRVPLYGR